MKVIYFNDFLKEFDLDVNIFIREIIRSDKIFGIRLLKKLNSRENQFLIIKSSKEEILGFSIFELINYTLYWNVTTQGHNFWNKVNNEWKKIISKELKHHKIIILNFKKYKLKNSNNRFHFKKLKI